MNEFPSTLVAAKLALAISSLHEQKTKNYLPDMSWPEVQDLLTRTDIAILPLTALEEQVQITSPEWKKPS